ncbi:alpha/beta hydrolase [Kribbella italica]|uniref:Pimeloyl-ACP methyl ester carboxylesterase n=1 Tax=Kribbella italica TaxID=1540520 RepID=A0A7W9MRN3_9ACTN|nr:alpha/beta hydrolase [Kribbella italica]MBB5833821.1 pimeloyl-ACP methyl ester carboxylesterase [Kribbella italica]
MTQAVGAGLRTVAVVSPEVAGRLAFELWRRPLRRGKVRATELEVHRKARVDIVDGVVTYAWGDGKRPVLLVHGWRSRASRFARFIEQLVDLGYSPVSYDAPGHGDSPGRAGTILDHERIINQLATQYGAFDGVIAHSLGVPFALYALRGDVHAERVVTISGFAEFGYLADAFCRGLGLTARTNQALRRRIERKLFGGDPEIWTKYSVAQGDIDLLSIHNDEDDVVDPAQAPILLSRYGDRATYRQTNGLGHRRIMIDPDVVAEAVAFVRNSDVAERLDLGA